MIEKTIEAAGEGNAACTKLIFDRIDGIQTPVVDVGDHPILVILAKICTAQKPELSTKEGNLLNKSDRPQIPAVINSNSPTEIIK